MMHPRMETCDAPPHGPTVRGDTPTASSFLITRPRLIVTLTAFVSATHCLIMSMSLRICVLVHSAA